MIRRLVILCLLAVVTVAAEARPQALVLGGGAPVHEAWPHVSMLADPDRSLTARSALAARDRFTPPPSTGATLGFRKEAIWLLVPIEVTANAGGQWILEIDYALINRADVYLAAVGGEPRHLATLGNLQPLASRPLNSRTPAVALPLEPGRRADLLVRIDTVNALILPIRLLEPGAFHQRANNEFLLQGLLIAIGLCLLVFSLQQWGSLGDSIYGKYALLVFCNLVFGVHLFGLGSMYLWRDWPWMETHAAGVASLLTACAMALFVEGVLGSDLRPLLRRALRSIAVAMPVCAALFALDIMGNRLLGIVMGVFGLLPALLGLQGALTRVRRGDSIGIYFIVGWICYFAGAAMLYGAVTGLGRANFWTLHALQFSATFDMLIFLRVMLLRSAARHREAERASRERDALKSLADTDALTGLLNRRGLNAALAAGLADCGPERRLAVFMLDLDGFKPVNDEHGHDAGDELLALIGQRLRGAVRADDAIARVGGDEFVVVARGLHAPALADELGAKLLALFREPLLLRAHAGVVCRVGVTIGYAIAPEDGTDASTLLKAADRAMYEGKVRGKGALMRSPAAAAG